MLWSHFAISGLGMLGLHSLVILHEAIFWAAFSHLEKEEVAVCISKECMSASSGAA